MHRQPTYLFPSSGENGRVSGAGPAGPGGPPPRWRLQAPLSRDAVAPLLAVPRGRRLDRAGRAGRGCPQGRGAAAWAWRGAAHATKERTGRGGVSADPADYRGTQPSSSPVARAKRSLRLLENAPCRPWVKSAARWSCWVGSIWRSYRIPSKKIKSQSNNLQNYNQVKIKGKML